MWSMHKASLMLPWWLKWYRRPGFNPWVGKIPWRRKRQPTPAFLPGKFRQRSLVGYSPWGCTESDTIEQLKPAFSFSVCCMSNYVFSRKSTYATAWVAKLNTFFLEHHFYLKEEQTVVIKIDISGRHVLKDK